MHWNDHGDIGPGELDTSDDEDGVVQAVDPTAGLKSTLPPMARGTNVAWTVNVVAPSGADLYVWVDFNGDGDWDDPGEQVVTALAVATGANAVGFAVPLNALAAAPLAVRFRLTSFSGLAEEVFAFGPMPGCGEVEDYISSLSGVVVPAVTEVGAVILVAGLALIAAFRMNKAKQTA